MASTYEWSRVRITILGADIIGFNSNSMLRDRQRLRESGLRQLSKWDPKMDMRSLPLQTKIIVYNTVLLALVKDTAISYLLTTDNLDKMKDRFELLEGFDKSVKNIARETLRIKQKHEQLLLTDKYMLATPMMCFTIRARERRLLSGTFWYIKTRKRHETFSYQIKEMTKYVTSEGRFTKSFLYVMYEFRELEWYWQRFDLSMTMPWEERRETQIHPDMTCYSVDRANMKRVQVWYDEYWKKGIGIWQKFYPSGKVRDTHRFIFLKSMEEKFAISCSCGERCAGMEHIIFECGTIEDLKKDASLDLELIPQHIQDWKIDAPIR